MAGSKLVPVDYLDFAAKGGDDTYIYGAKTGVSQSILVRRDVDGNEVQQQNAALLLDNSVALGASSEIRRVESAGGFLFGAVKRFSDSARFIYKSVDNGANWGNNSPAFDNLEPVSRVGFFGGTHTINSSWLRGMPELVVDGVSTLFYGEYNTNASRTTGSTNDQVRIMKSIDGGTTWTTALEWNTDGSNYVTHVHVMLKDPYSDYIYIGFGDGTKSAVVRWDGFSTGGSNTDPATMTAGAITGFLGKGGKPYQCGDFIFTEDYIHRLADIGNTNDADPDRGIFREDRDFENSIRVCDDNLAHDYHAIWWSAILPNGHMVAVEIMELGNTDYNIYLYSSVDGLSWAETGKFYQDTNSQATSVTAFFVWNGNIYMSSTNAAAGKAIHATVVFNSSGAFEESEADIMNPIYWVSQSGSDSNDGYRPSTPFATLKYAVEGDRMTHGGRVMMSGGYHETAAADIKWDANSNPAPTTNKTIIEGVEGSTWLKYDTENAGHGFALAVADGNIVFKNMRVFDDNGNALVSLGTHTGTLEENVNKGKIRWRN